MKKTCPLIKIKINLNYKGCNSYFLHEIIFFSPEEKSTHTANFIYPFKLKVTVFPH